MALDYNTRLGIRRSLDRLARQRLAAQGGYERIEEAERQRDVHHGLRPSSWARPRVDADQIMFLLGQGLKQTEIAQDLGVSPSAVSHTIRRKGLR